MKIEILRKIRPTGAYILEILKEENRPLSVSEIAYLGDLCFSTVYEHLRKLIELGLVEVEKRKGERKTYYKIKRGDE